MKHGRRKFWLAAIAMLFAGSSLFAINDNPSKSNKDDPLTLVVMDPLCDKLACDCVKGYAQRKYEALGEYLGKQLDRPVNILWGESIPAALEESTATPAIVIGKHSVVVSDAKSANIVLRPIARLTGSDGSTSQTGLIVVRTADPATQVSQLKGYRIFFGPSDCDEKYAAPMALLRENGIEVPPQPEISGACSEAATKLMSLDKNTKAAAVISSYAEPLLAGCGTIEKGDLRIIGISGEVPFVTAFVNEKLPESTRAAITSALLEAGKNANLLKALETKSGFVPYQESSPKTSPPNEQQAAETADQSATKKK